MPQKLEERDWQLLLGRIKDGKCTPFLGAGACYGTLPLGDEIAANWAKEHEYPLDDCADLARVAQYLAVTYDAVFPKEKLLKQFQDTAPPDFKKPHQVHSLLAQLPLPVYITTNYDNFMVQALEQHHRDPRREMCQWNELVKNGNSIFETEPDFEPSPANPIVFHLHGHNEVPESLVLTEDDYLDFLVKISRDQDLIPPRIQRAFTGSSLLFIGYRLADWDFRVLFRSLVSYLEKSIAKTHVSVQLVPMGEEVSQKKKESAQEYLDKYFGELKVRVFWGTCEEFATELSKRWVAFENEN